MVFHDPKQLLSKNYKKCWLSKTQQSSAFINLNGLLPCHVIDHSDYRQSDYLAYKGILTDWMTKSWHNDLKWVGNLNMLNHNQPHYKIRKKIWSLVLCLKLYPCNHKHFLNIFMQRSASYITIWVLIIIVSKVLQMGLSVRLFIQTLVM